MKKNVCLLLILILSIMISGTAYALNIEAESVSGQSGFAPFTVQSDSAASAGKYIVVPNGTGNSNMSSVTGNSVSYSFNLSEAATVTLKASVLLPSVVDDSFWYSLDSGSWTRQNDAVYTSWTTITLATYNNLSAGAHTINLAPREDGSQIDQIILEASNGEITGGSTNKAPTVDAGANATIQLSGSASLDATVDDDGLPNNTLTTTWSKLSGPGTVTFGDASAVDTTATFSVVGIYYLQLRVSDGELSASDSVTITVNQDPPGNSLTSEAESASGQSGFAPFTVQNHSAPNSGQYIVVPNGTGNSNMSSVTGNSVSYSFNLSEAATVTLKANVLFPTYSDDSFWYSLDSGSWTRQNDAVYTSWTTITLATYNNLSAGGHTINLAPREDGSQIDQIILEASNGQITGGSTTNKAPIVEAGANATINISVNASLDATVSDDNLPNGTLTTTWSKLSGPGTVTFGDTSAVDTTATFSAVGTYVLQLTANDSELSTTDTVTITVRDGDPGSANYVKNKSPLYETSYLALPLGSIRARGWLLKQLELQRDGLTGHSENIYSDLGSNSGWLGGTGESWERGPYYFRGLIALAYTLDDADLKLKAQKWIDGVINSQQANGLIGPASLNAADWWPRMPALDALQDYYEATGDIRALNCLNAYFNYQINNVPGNLGFWGASRAEDNAKTVMFAYNNGGDSSLLGLIDTLRGLTFDWSGNFNNGTFPNTHIVNVAEGLKAPAIYYQRSGSNVDRDAYLNGYNRAMLLHGQPTGMFSGTEHMAGKGSMKGVELCASVESIVSHGHSFRTFGHPETGDITEKIAFNSLPGALSKTSRQMQYYVVPNQVRSIRGNLDYGENYYNGLTPSSVSGYPCCNFNWHQGWPKFTQNSWMATNDNGLVVHTYAPTQVTAKVGNGVTVTITEDTNYPFEEQISLTLSASQSVDFPLYLRIPGWCNNASIYVNGTLHSSPAAGAIASVSRQWNDNDQVTINLPMEIKLEKQINNSISVERGPLVYSLKIDETWTQVVSNTVDGLDFGEYEVTPASAWNYALILDQQNPESSFAFHTGTMPENPFEQATTPVWLTVEGKQLDSWGLSNTNVHAAEVPFSPVAPTGASETITLIPFGAENIRVSYFPYSDGSEPVVNLATQATPTASHCNPSDTVLAINDGNASTNPRHTFWNHLGTSEWVQLDWATAQTIDQIYVWWFDDTGVGQCRVPASYTIQYNNGSGFQDVVNASGYGTQRDVYNKTTFDPVTTNQIRINVQLQNGVSGGVLEIAAFE